MRQKNKFTALVALAQTVSRRSIKETAINAWKVLLMLVFIVASALPAWGGNCFLITFEPTDIPPGATLSNYVNSPDLGINNITYDFVTADWKIQGSLISCSAERIPSEWESGKALIEEFYRQNFGVTVKDEANLLVLAQPTADGGYKRLNALELYQGGNILDCEIVPQECTKNAYCVGVSVESMSPVYAEQLKRQKEIIDKKCAPGPVDECDQKIPLPKTAEDFMHEEILPSPVLGNNPEEISPIGFGDIATGGNTVTFRIDICPFEGPMAFFLWYEYYALDANNKVTTFFTPSEKPEDILWKYNVTDSIKQEIPGDFGGLFPDAQHLPKGNNFFHLMAIPLNGNMDFTAYEWTYDLTIKCEDYIRQPEGKQKFHIKPAAMPLTGNDPEKIQPFAIGPYALGGDVLDMRVDFCAFEPFETFAESTDIHFGIYCPSEDLFNIYFVNGEAKTEQDLFQKVSSIKFLFSPELPPIAYSYKNLFENEQEGAVRFFGGKTSELPKKRCYYIAAVTPRGVRDRFYAWILPLDVNIKNAMAEYLLNKN